ncbi:MAG: Hsp20/alpha crystallin family protein [Lachnospiraceae bacterium]
MLMPSIFGTNTLFDDFFDDSFFNDKDMKNIEKKLYGHRAKNVMNTDVKETEDGYELEMDLPGFKKEEVTVELENGYITIRATKNLDKDEESKGKYIRRERYAGVCQRSFFIGDIKPENIKAKYEYGVLTIMVPKEEPKKLASGSSIAIE